MVSQNFEMRGITEIIYDIHRRRLAMPGAVEAFVNGITDDVHAKYVVNLSGSVPSTSERPLPVGVRSGRLRAGALKQKAARVGDVWAGRVYDDVPHAGFIEFGTRRITPRQPLANAVREKAQVDERMDDKVLFRVWKK